MSNDSPLPLVHRSSTRKKACAACMKAKRRCDLTLPSCSRCRTRNLRCIYVEKHMVQRIGSKAEWDTTVAHSSFSSAGTMSPRVAGSSDGGYISECPVGPPLCPIDSGFQEEALSVDVMNILKTPLRSFAFPEHGTLSPRQINYMVVQFKSSVESLVLYNQTAFIHPLLYQDTMPTGYQDALSICSLYSQKTPRNQEMTFRMLDCKLAALMMSSTSLPRLEDDLLALQSLILYQVIRLFDGDVRQRANAERHLDLLDSWTLRLQQNYFQFVGTPPAESEYGHWVLVESIRRTTMISVVLRGLYCAMKDGYCELVPLLCTLPVSNTGHLWKASKTDWQQARRGNDLLTYAEFTADWNAGNVSDLGEYEKLLLVACRYAVGTGDFQPA